MILLRVVDQEEAFAAIDFNVIFLLAGMMIMANTLAETGLFQWIAIHSVKLGRGEPIYVLTILAIVTAVLSAFLDNVTTVVLMAPITLFVAGTLEISPSPLLVAQVIASNLGGSATLIGDPPNILIGSAAGLSFADFLDVLSPLVILTTAAFLIVMRLFFQRKLRVRPELRQRVMAMDTRDVITDRRLLVVSLTVFGATIIGFGLHSVIDYELATLAIGGAAVLMLVTQRDPEEVLKTVEWDSLFFFIGLFIIVGGVRESGLIEDVTTRVLEVSTDMTFLTLTVLWVSGIVSGFAGSIPYTTAMIPVVEDVSSRVHEGGSASNPLWWALALGADFGANLTLIGGAANVIVAGMAKRAGASLNFGEFLLYGGSVTLMSLAFSSMYLWLRFLT